MATTAETARALPGPLARPVLGWQGNLLQFNRDPLAYLQTAHDTYGPVTAFVAGSTRAVGAFGSEHATALAGRYGIRTTLVASRLSNRR